MPDPGQRIADRYELLEELPRALSGRLFRARDLAFGDIVALKRLGPNLPSLRQLEADLRRAQSEPHPQLVRHHALDAVAGLHVREWVHGFSLLELLRRHRELPAPFALGLLDTLPALLDFAASRRLPLPGSLLAKLLVRFDEKIAPAAVLEGSPASWPPFSLKLNLISVRASLPQSDAETTMTTMEDVATKSADLSLAPTKRLAALLYEILGGPVRRSGERRYTPLPALREEGNGVLRRALVDSPYQDCRALWADLLLAEPTSVRPPRPLPPAPAAPEIVWTEPEDFLAPPQPATVLRLQPANPALPAIHLVARGTFRLGRSLTHADFPTRFLPVGASHDDITNQLSRVHVLAEASGARLLLRDGNGDAPSVNGSTLDEQPLDSDQPAPLGERALLTLGGVYSLEVTARIRAGAAPLKIKNAPDPATPAGRELGGAVFFLPAHRQVIVRHAVWIFSEAGFGLDAAQRLVWDLRGTAPSPASFFHDRGCFWLANRGLAPDTLTVAGTPLAPGEIAPLTRGSELKIGTQFFTIEAD